MGADRTTRSCTASEATMDAVRTLLWSLPEANCTGPSAVEADPIWVRCSRSILTGADLLCSSDLLVRPMDWLIRNQRSFLAARPSTAQLSAAERPTPAGEPYSKSIWKAADSRY